MLSYRTIEPHTLELLRAIQSELLGQNIRLVGGTALALQLGHRQSVDLDFFGKHDMQSEEIKALLSSVGSVKVHKESENINIYDVDGIKVDFVNYSYEWITEAVVEDGLVLASPQDIAAMKVNAIEGRGTKKDFIDIYVLLKHFTLEQILSFYQTKYPEYSVFRALLSLTYFEDAEPQMMPRMFVDVNWDAMKILIKCCVNDYQRNL